MTKSLSRAVRRGGTYARLSLFAALLCAVSDTEELFATAATHFRPTGERGAHPSYERKLAAAKSENDDRIIATGGGETAKQQQGKPSRSAKAGGVAEVAPESTRTSAAVATTAQGAESGARAPAERGPTDAVDQSMLGEYNLHQVSHSQERAPAAAGPAYTKGAALVSQLLRGEVRLPKDSGVPRSVEPSVSPRPDEQIFVSGEKQDDKSDVILAPEAEETASAAEEPTVEAEEPLAAPLEEEQAGGETAAAVALVLGDREGGQTESAPGGLTPPSASAPPPVEGKEVFAVRLHPAWQIFVPQPTSPAAAAPSTPPEGAHSNTGSGGVTALEVASKWDELSRQHQQMLLSRNLTSVVKLFVDYTQPDYVTPWQMHAPRHTAGSAFVVEGRFLLTSGHLVDWQTRVLARRHGNAKKFTATVVAVGHDCDLALLTVDSEEFWEGLHPPTFGPVPQLRDTVTLLGYPTGGDQLSITEGVVSRVGMWKYVHSGHELLTVQIDAAVNPGNSGGPALVHGKVVGIAFQGFSDLQSVGYIVPYPVIRHFLNDLALHQRFTGFPTLGIKVTPLENQGMKAYKKLTSVKASDLPPGITPSGVIVVEVDTLRKERYLSGLLRLPFASSILPQETRLAHLLQEDPLQPPSPAPLPRQHAALQLHYLAAVTPETAVSFASLYPPLGIGATMFLPAYPAPAGVAGGADIPRDTYEPLGALPGADSPEGAAASPRSPGEARSQAAEEYDLQDLQNELEENESPFEEGAKRKERLLTSENDLIVPNVHYNPHHAFDVEHVGLEVGDVLLAVDGIDVAEDGTVPFRNMERNQLEYVLLNRFNGEVARALVLRNGQLMSVLAPLTIPNTMIPMHTWDVKPKYFVFGGLVFVQLTRLLVDQSRHLDIPALVYAMLARMATQEREKDEFILLSVILPSELTIGYSQAPALLRKVQGYAIRNFEELVQLVEQCSDPFVEFIVEVETTEEVPIVLDRKKALELNASILEQHGVPRDRSSFL